MKAPALPFYCERCQQVFKSTNAYPDRCNLCLSPDWMIQKRYRDKPNLFDQEENAV
jgi:hypothetical protein